MGLITFVKVGNITNLSDARYCAGMGVDDIGFCTDRNSQSYIQPSLANSILEWVSGVNIVAEGIPSDEDSYSFDKIQVGLGEVHPDPSIPKIITLTVSDIKKELTIPENTEYIVVDGTDNEIPGADLEIVNELTKKHKVVLGFGFNTENVKPILTKIKLFGIAMNGSAEIRPGFNDYDELADILELLSDED